MRQENLISKKGMLEHVNRAQSMVSASKKLFTSWLAAEVALLCKAHGLTYRAGMGIWNITGLVAGFHIDYEDFLLLRAVGGADGMRMQKSTRELFEKHLRETLEVPESDIEKAGVVWGSLHELLTLIDTVSDACPDIVSPNILSELGEHFLKH
jgi:hypothetical protein